MDERQHRAVRKHRGQIDELRKQAEGFAAGEGKPSETRVQKVVTRSTQKQADYARFRLREGLGPDSLYIDDSTLDAALKNLIDKSRFSRSVEKMIPMRIGLRARQELLLSGFSFAESLDSALESQNEMMSFLSERSPLKNACRRWASLLADPYVTETIDQLRRLAENFENTGGLLQRRVDRVRRKYEDQQGSPDFLEMVREGSQTLLRASNDLSNLAAELPEDIREVFGIFRSLEQQLREIEEIKELLNAELRKFMGTLTPLYLSLVHQQAKEVKRAVLGRAKPSAKLVDRMTREARQADYLLAGAGLPVPHPKIPKEFRAIRQLKSYQSFKRSAGIDQLQNQDTVEFPTNR